MRSLRTTLALCLILTVSWAVLVPLDSSFAALPSKQTQPSATDSSVPSVPELSLRGQYRFVPGAKHVTTEIRLANGFVFDTERGEPTIRQNLRAESVALPEEKVALLVQVDGPVESSWLDEMRAAGATIESFVPNSAFLVRIAGEDRSSLERLSFVNWVGAYHPAYRISGQQEMSRRSGSGNYQVLLFSDADLTSVTDRVRFLGGRVTDSSVNAKNRMLAIELDRSRMESLAAHPDVQWVEPKPEFFLYNDDVQWVDQTNIVNNRKVWDNGIDGTGQIVMVGDSGLRTSHNMFRDNSVTISNYGDFPTHRKVIAYKRAATNSQILFGDTAAASFHGTHTSGTFVGNDDGLGSSANDGIAKGAKLWFVDGGGNSNAVITPLDLNEYFSPSYEGNAGGAARISSNSWGSNQAGAYTISSMTADQFMWDHKDYLIVFSNGNSGVAGSVGSPASAKNILSSGGTRNGTASNLIYSSTSRGPTQDGRRKPTVCSPGQSVQSATGANDTGLLTLSGTSMSCPNLAGSAALARQYFEDGYYPTGSAVPANGFTPSAALLKAMMVNSGVDNFAAFSIPDHNIGWGRILLDNVMYFTGDTRRTVILDESDGLSTGEAREYEIYVASASEDFKVSLVWTDFASTPAAAINLVNDLDLVVEQGATTYLGNVYSGGQSVTGGAKDAINVEENVRRASPTVGVYTVRVEGANIPMGPQPYALVISGDLGGDAGLLTLDRPAYGGSENVGIRVEDTDAGASVTVEVSSTTETTAESIVIPGANGVYEGSIPVTLAAPVADGSISVSEGDQITVSYTNPSPSHTHMQTVSVILDDAEITNVAADPAGNSAIVTWDTNALTTSQIEYGTTPALGSLSTLDPERTLAHSHEIEGLTPETTYYFDVISVDAQGNEVRDDFGGMHYRFTTGRRADVLLVNSDPVTTENFERYYSAFDATGWTYNVWEKQQADVPEVGDLNSGMRSYNAVWWQAGWEKYPQFERDARDSIEAYHDGGGRIAFVSHDVAWTFSSAADYMNANRKAWFENMFHGVWTNDPLTWSTNTGVGGDPITGSFTGGVSYTPHRDGAAGDEINPLNGTGTATGIWFNNFTPVDEVGVRWENGVPNGTAGTGVWGGQPTRVVSMLFEWLNVDGASATSADRNEILDKTIAWLVGGDHPDAMISSPNGGESFVSSPVSISWTSGADTGNGRSVATTRLEYSDDGGMSWTLITSSPGSSPYSWDVSALPSGTQYQVRAVVLDDGSPVLAGVDASNANFTLNLPGNETRGPVVLAGTPGISPNPVVKPNPTTFTATVSDALTGGSNVTAAEWSVGASAAAAGSGTAMTGSFGSVEVAVSANIDSNVLPGGATSLWVRGQDAAGNWGAATELPIQVNGGGATDVNPGLPPVAFALGQNFPNPFVLDTRISFALPTPQNVELRVFNVEGRAVRTLMDRSVAAGTHQVNWDGRDASGQPVASGVYFYRLISDDHQAERKMVILQ